MGSVCVWVGSPLFGFCCTLIDSNLPWLTVLCLDLTCSILVQCALLGLTVFFLCLTVLYFGWKCSSLVWQRSSCGWKCSSFVLQCYTLVESALPLFYSAILWLKVLFVCFTVLFFGWNLKVLFALVESALPLFHSAFTLVESVLPGFVSALLRLKVLTFCLQVLYFGWKCSSLVWQCSTCFDGAVSSVGLVLQTAWCSWLRSVCLYFA